MDADRRVWTRCGRRRRSSFSVTGDGRGLAFRFCTLHLRFEFRLFAAFSFRIRNGRRDRNHQTRRRYYLPEVGPDRSGALHGPTDQRKSVRLFAPAEPTLQIHHRKGRCHQGMGTRLGSDVRWTAS